MVQLISCFLTLPKPNHHLSDVDMLIKPNAVLSLLSRAFRYRVINYSILTLSVIALAGLSTLNNLPINNLKFCRNMNFHTNSDIFKQLCKLFLQETNQYWCLESITKVGLISVANLKLKSNIWKLKKNLSIKLT